VVVGTVIGVALSRGDSTPGPATAQPSDGGALPSVTGAPPAPLSPFPTAVPTPTDQPSPRVFIVTPTPSPGATSSGRPSPSAEPATEPLTLSADPPSGPNGTTVTVQGTGWTRRGTVTLDYLDPLGRQTGSHATAAVDARGRFTTTISAVDPANLPGRHTIRATDGAQTDTVPFDVSG
jgi:hypothetical protein